MSRFSFVPYDDTSKKISDDLRQRCEMIEEMMMTNLPASTYRMWALGCLEMAHMFAGKAIRDDQFVRENRRFSPLSRYPVAERSPSQLTRNPTPHSESSDVMKQIKACEGFMKVINSNSLENASDTPDFILASFLTSCLGAFDAAVNRRTEWYKPEVDNDSPQ